MCYSTLKTTSTRGFASGIFVLDFMLSLSFCLRLIILADSLGHDAMFNVVVKGADKNVFSVG